MALSKLKVSIDLSDLVDLVDGIPSVGFYKLESELYFLKENLETCDDTVRLVNATQECIDKAKEAGNKNLELLLRWHRIENMFCGVYKSADNIKSTTLKQLEDLTAEANALAAPEETSAKPKYPKHVTLCRLFSYIASGYVDRHEFDTAIKLLEKCETSGYVTPANSCLDPRLDNAHIAYFHYAKGRCYSYKHCYASNPSDVSAGELHVLKQSAIDNFKMSKATYMAKGMTSNASYHVCEIAMCCLQMTRVYLDVRPEAMHAPLPPEDVQSANKYFIKGMTYYDDYEKQSKRRALRKDARIDWWQSLLYFRMYPTYTEKEYFKDILLKRARFYCERSVVKLEKAVYRDKPRIRHLFLEITKKILPPPVDASTDGVVTSEERPRKYRRRDVDATVDTTSRSEASSADETRQLSERLRLDTATSQSSDVLL